MGDGLGDEGVHGFAGVEAVDELEPVVSWAASAPVLDVPGSGESAEVPGLPVHAAGACSDDDAVVAHVLAMDGHGGDAVADAKALHELGGQVPSQCPVRAWHPKLPGALLVVAQGGR